MQLTTFWLPWASVICISVFSSAVCYVIRNESVERSENTNHLKSKYSHERQMAWNEEQNQILAKKYEVINIRIGRNPSKIDTFVAVQVDASFMNETELLSNGVKNKRSNDKGESNKMKESHTARCNRRGGRGGPGGWYGRGHYSGGPWVPPPLWAWGPPPWALGPPPWTWISPWGLPPWAWGSSWSWGGQYNQSMPNPWATTPPVNPTRPTPAVTIGTNPPTATTLPTVSRPAALTIPSPGTSTIRPMERPTTVAPGISTVPNQGMSTRPPMMILTTTMLPTVTRPGSSAASNQEMPTRGPTTGQPGSSTTPQGMTSRPPSTTTTVLGATSSNFITPTVLPLLSSTTPKQGSLIPSQEHITTIPPGGQLIPGQMTTRIPIKHGPIEPDMHGRQHESSDQDPTASSASPLEKPGFELNTKSSPTQAPSQHEQSSMELGTTMGPVRQSNDGLIDPAPSMDSDDLNDQVTVSPDTLIRSGVKNEQDSTNVVTNEPERLINAVQTENGPDPVNPNPSTGNVNKGSHSHSDSDKLKDTDVQGAQISREQSPIEATSDQLQQSSEDPAPELQPDHQSEQGLDLQTPSYQIGQNGSPGQDSMNPGPKEEIVDQSKDRPHDTTGTESQGVQVPANPGRTSSSSNLSQQGLLEPSPEVKSDGVHNQQGLDSHTPSDHKGQKGSQGQEQMNPSPTEGITHQSKDEPPDQTLGTENQSDQVTANPDSMINASNQSQQGLVEPSPEVNSDGVQNQQCLDSHTPSDYMGQNGSQGQEQMNPSPTEGIAHQNKDEPPDQILGTENQSDQVTANPDPMINSSNQSQQGLVEPSPEVKSDSVQNQQGLDSHTPSDRMQNGSQGQEQMNPSPTEGIVDQNKDVLGTDDQGTQTSASPDPSSEHILPSPTPEIIPDVTSENAPVVPNVSSEQVRQDASSGNNQEGSSQTEITEGQTKDGSQALIQSETDNEDLIVPTRGPENQTPDSLLDSQGNTPDSLMEQGDEQDGSSPKTGTDGQNNQDLPKYDHVGTDNQSDISQTVVSNEDYNIPTDQIKSNDSPGQVDSSLIHGVDNESKPGQAGLDDQGAQELPQPVTTIGSDEQIPQGSMGLQ